MLAKRVAAVSAESGRTGWRGDSPFRLLGDQERTGVPDCGKTNGNGQNDEGPDSFHITLAASEPYKGEYVAEEAVQSLWLVGSRVSNDSRARSAAWEFLLAY
jgi:hypothetical protein